MNSNDIKLKKVEEFFDYDVEVKRLINEIIPNEIDLYDNESKFQYLERVLRNLQKIELYLSKMMLEHNIFKVEELKKLSDKLKSDITSGNFQRLLNSGYDQLMNYMNSYITYMRPEFVDSVKNGFKGYYLLYGEGVLEPTTINEFLHYIHSCVVNREDFYFNVPIIETTKMESDWKGVSLRGVNNDIGAELYHRILDSKIDSDCIDILNLKDRIIIMARDLGHAAVIEIDLTNESKVFVKYFIPKNNNMEMISKLKGIQANREEFATGDFETSKEGLTKEICSLMKGIPTDADRVIDYKKDL